VQILYLRPAGQPLVDRLFSAVWLFGSRVVLGTEAVFGKTTICLESTPLLTFGTRRKALRANYKFDIWDCRPPKMTLYSPFALRLGAGSRRRATLETCRTRNAAVPQVEQKVSRIQMSTTTGLGN